MNKYLLAIPLIASMLFMACDPSVESEGSPSSSMTAEQLERSVTLTQTTPNQNKFSWQTSPATYVQLLDQNGNILSSGTSGSIIGIPPLTNITVRAMNQDASIVSFSNDVTITEYVDVAEIYRLLFGDDYTTKTWGWPQDDPDTQLLVGNGEFNKDTYGPSWWGRPLNQFDDDEMLRGEGRDSRMVFNISGFRITTTIENGSTTSGYLTFKEGNDKFSNWYGHLSSSIGVLGGRAFNDASLPKGTIINDFHIVELTEDRMVLAWAEFPDADWSAGWWWIFEAK